MPCRAVAIYFGSAARLNREQLKRLVKRTNTLGRYRTEVTPDMRVLGPQARLSIPRKTAATDQR